MSSRSRRDAALKNVESLLLAQSVWEHGANSWSTVAKILSKHPLISRPKSFFTAQSAHIMYEHLMKEAGLERTEACNTSRAAENLKLAEKFYSARVEELRELIIAEETNFKSILSEIENIRSGNFDAEIKAMITGIPIVPTEPVQETKVSEAISSSDDVFGGSELSGLTATPASPSQSHENPPEEPGSSLFKPSLSEPPQDPTPGVEAPAQTPTVDDIPSPLLGTPSPIEVEVDEGIGFKYEEEKEKPVVTDEPSEVIVPSPPKEGSEIDQGEARSMHVDDQEETREEEEEVAMEVVDRVAAGATEGNDEVAQGMEEIEGETHKQAEPSAETPEEEIDVMETREVSVEPTPAPEDVPETQEPPLASPAVPTVDAELVVDDGESSGEEPLHVSRRSTRRRRSTLSPVQPLQSRGKTRRQRAESPPTKTKEESEADQMDEADDVLEGTPNVELDQDASPAPVDSTTRRGKRKASFVEGIEPLREKKRARDDSEPADEDEPGPSSYALRGRRPGTRSEEQVALKRFQNVIGMLHSQISQHRNGNIFHNPIKTSEAPDYHEIVKRPMDLKTIKMKVKDVSIANSLEYQRDIFLMFANALMYNRPGSDVHTMAEDKAKVTSPRSDKQKASLDALNGTAVLIFSRMVFRVVRNSKEA